VLEVFYGYVPVGCSPLPQRRSSKYTAAVVTGDAGAKPADVRERRISGAGDA